ncbi:MAG TPA: hypothetical protein VHL34_11275 [Rhizomicrobium sp.]|jgi:hypothetical protein|nr:hypothetical protein [Rhizomicrobium sp.]
MQAGAPFTNYQRTDESLAFEAFWRSLCDGRPLPPRNAFRPSLGVRFLRDLITMEAPGPRGDGMRIRFFGERAHEFAGRNLAGLNYVDLLPAQHRNGAVAAGRLMAEMPCGLWQISPLHLARGYAQCVEFTAVPLGPDDNGMRAFLCLLRPVEGIFLSTLPVNYGVAIDTALQFRFLHLGAGEPAWPALAA